MFVDYAEVIIRSGHGGAGCVSFHREKFKPRGGPDGGDGGAGGNVIFIGDRGVDNLSRYRYTPRLFAKNGQPGMGSNCSGKRGQDFEARVPCGTIVRHADTNELICEILQPDEPVTVATGGIGGRGNQHFATPTRQAPRHAQPGMPGEEFRAVLELKVMADVGLVGLPNAGKSSLVSVVSHATPKIADYPFTTMNPVVGVIELPEYRTMVMADIPGIIEGAADGRGLGITFLKHVERTRVLLFVIDVSCYADSDPAQALAVVQGEISRFGHGLPNKPFLIAANKSDLDPDGDARAAFLERIDPALRSRVYPISTATRAGIDQLVTALDKTVMDVVGRDT